MGDGRGAEPAQLRFRAADAGDADFLLSLRNDPVSVAFSTTGRAVSEPDHRAWMAGWLAGSSTRVWIAEAARRPVGQARIDVEDGIATISLAIAPDARGQGYGRRLIAEVLALARADDAVRQVRAVVHKGNVASVAAFEANDFCLAATEGGTFDVLVYDM